MADETDVVEQEGAQESQSPVQREEAASAALESKVAAGLAALNDDAGDETVETEPSTAEGTEGNTDPGETVSETVQGSEKTADDDAETGAAEKDDGAENEVEAKAEPAAPKPSTPTLPAAYVRSLKAYDWSDEEIEAAAKNPNFLATAGKIHANRIAETAKWAEIGRQARQQPSQGNDASAQPQGLQLLKAPDVAALKKKYGDDAMIDEIMAPVQQAMAAINQIIPVIQQTQGQSQQQHLETLATQIDTFFGSKDLVAYAELYGDSSKQKTAEQVTVRNNVLETADALIAGARMQGRKLSLNDALTLAHDSISSGFKVKAAREQIKKTLKQRQAGITLKPGGQKTAIKAKPGERGSMERKVSAGLAAVFG